MTQKMYKISKTGVVLITALYMLAGCYPKGPEYYSDLDLTVTEYDIDYKFGEQKYYHMPDSVGYKTNIKDSELDPTDVENLLQQIESNFTKQGYIRIPYLNEDNQDSIEFVIAVSAIAAESSGVGWVGPPCYPYYWYCGGGGYYPPYWGGYYSYSYTTGSVVMNWFDPQVDPVPVDGGEAQPVHWLAIFNGLMSSTPANNKSRIATSIDQAFKQSPYIQSGR